jgi:hypothetical protein
MQDYHVLEILTITVPIIVSLFTVGAIVWKNQSLMKQQMHNDQLLLRQEIGSLKDLIHSNHDNLLERVEKLEQHREKCIYGELNCQRCENGH